MTARGLDSVTGERWELWELEDMPLQFMQKLKTDG